jgi:outer membrane lipoprotein-sorting protein
MRIHLLAFSLPIALTIAMSLGAKAQDASRSSSDALPDSIEESGTELKLDESADRDPASEKNKKKKAAAKSKSTSKKMAVKDVAKSKASTAAATAKSGAKSVAKKPSTPAPLKKRNKALPEAEDRLLQDVDARYQNAKAIAMKVDKTLKIGLLAEERKSSGSLWISEGRIRMELEGVEKSVLVVNKKNLWAATYPGSEFPDAPVQVIRGNSASKKGQQKNAMSLLSVGGFLNIFNPTGVKTLASGQKSYTLAPKKGQSDDFKKAVVTLTMDGKSIAEIKYWDPRDNETQYLFRDIAFDQKEAFGKKIDSNLFDFTPPPGAEVMNL